MCGSNSFNFSADKVQIIKHPSEVIPKKNIDAPSQAQIPLGGGYGMFPYYPTHQQPYLVSQQQTSSVLSNDHSNIKQTTPTSASASSATTDYNKIKDPPLDLITKPQCQPIDASSTISLKENLPHSVTPPSISQSKYMGGYYPYK